jgi:hypothetical protein
MHRALLFTGLVIVTPGCESASDTRFHHAVRDSADITIIDNRDGAWADGEGWRVSAEPLVEIGAVSSENPALEFSRIHGVARLSDGRIVVLEGQDSEIRWFDAQGRHLLTRGGTGGGPGEFGRASAMFLLPGDTIVVEDAWSGAVSFFDQNGDYVRQQTFDRERLWQSASFEECADRILPDLSRLMCVSEPGEPERQADPGPGHLRRFARFVRVSPGLDSVIPLGRYGGIEQWGVDAGGRTRTVIANGGPAMRIAIAINPAYSIEVWAPDGRLVHVVRRAGDPVVPTAQQREQAMRMLAGFAGSDEALANRLVAEVDEPTSMPAVLRMLVDASNHLWVYQRALIARPGTIDVFDPGGRYLGEVVMPNGFGAFEIGDDYVLGIQRTEDDVSIVRLHALDRASVR